MFDLNPGCPRIIPLNPWATDPTSAVDFRRSRMRCDLNGDRYQVEKFAKNLEGLGVSKMET